MAREMVETLLSLIEGVRETILSLSDEKLPIDDTEGLRTTYKADLHELLDRLVNFINSGNFGSLPSEVQQSVLNRVQGLKPDIERAEHFVVCVNMMHLNTQLDRFESKEPSSKTAYPENLLSEFLSDLRVYGGQLEKYKGELEEHKKQLSTYADERKKANREIPNLIEKAREALQYTTTAGISAAFEERYISNKKWWKVGLNFLWVLAAGGCIAGAIYAISPLFSRADIELGAYFARIAIMPPAIGAAWFCATRYVRYSNITEDYGYKSILAKSMVAFLDQFDGKERTLYLKTALTQLFQDPLRKRHDMEYPAAGFLRRNKRTEKDDEGDQ